jgi:hypothetical protein
VEVRAVPLVATRAAAKVFTLKVSRLVSRITHLIVISLKEERSKLNNQEQYIPT